MKTLDKIRPYLHAWFDIQIQALQNRWLSGDATDVSEFYIRFEGLSYLEGWRSTSDSIKADELRELPASGESRILDILRDL